MFAEENAAAVGAWGLIISVVGFIITIWQIYRARTAAEAAQAAVGNLKFKFQFVETSVDASRASRLLENTLIHLKHGSWANAAHSLWDAQSLLSQIRDSLKLSASSLDLTDKNIADFLNYIQALEDFSQNQAGAFDARQIIRSIRMQINVLDQALISSQKELYDV